MSFTVHVEHQIVGGKTVLEKFEGVETFDDPPMTSTLHLKFADEDRDEKRLDYGNVVKATDNE